MHDLKCILVSVRVVKTIGAKKQKIPNYTKKYQKIPKNTKKYQKIPNTKNTKSFFSTKNHSHVPYQL